MCVVLAWVGDDIRRGLKYIGLAQRDCIPDLFRQEERSLSPAGAVFFRSGGVLQGMEVGGHAYKETLQLFIVVAATLGANLPTIYSLTHGIYQVFPFLYILPIILIVYFYPRYGVIYSLMMSLVYIGLVYYFGSSNTGLIAISTAWFAIFIAIGIVASSYANRLRAEALKIRKIFDTSQDGLFCFNRHTLRVTEINPMCARMLRYGRGELLGRDITTFWQDRDEIGSFISCVNDGEEACRREILLKAKDGTVCRCLISVVFSSPHTILCSATDLSNQSLADEEIRQTLEDLERQVRERTAHLEKINEELRAEINERRKFERTILPGGQKDDREQKRRQP